LAGKYWFKAERQQRDYTKMRNKSITSFFLVCLTVSLFGELAGEGNLWLEVKAFSERSDHFKLMAYGEPGKGSSSGEVLYVDTPLAGPHKITYKFEIAESGVYRIWAATTPPNINWASPFIVTLDGIEMSGEDFLKASGPQYGRDENPTMFSWYQFFKKELSPGEHELSFEIKKQREVKESYDESVSKFSFYMDAIFITSSGEEPHGPLKPVSLSQLGTSTE
jgi:hypothetical protein